MRAAGTTITACLSAHSQYSLDCHLSMSVASLVAAKGRLFCTLAIKREPLQRCLFEDLERLNGLVQAEAHRLSHRLELCRTSLLLGRMRAEKPSTIVSIDEKPVGLVKIRVLVEGQRHKRLDGRVLRRVEVGQKVVELAPRIGGPAARLLARARDSH